MRILKLVILVFLSITTDAIRAADSYELISAVEYQRSIEADDGSEPPIAKAQDPLAPTIIVAQPGERAQYSSPVDIDVRFEPAPGASINLDTLKITYGFLGIDVTERVLENASVTQVGIYSNGAELPAGKHKLTVSVEDNQGRQGKRQFKFRIAN